MLLQVLSLMENNEKSNCRSKNRKKWFDFVRSKERAIEHRCAPNTSWPAIKPEREREGGESERGIQVK